MNVVVLPWTLPLAPSIYTMVLCGLASIAVYRGRLWQADIARVVRRDFLPTNTTVHDRAKAEQDKP